MLPDDVLANIPVPPPLVQKSEPPDETNEHPEEENMEGKCIIFLRPY